MAIKDIFLPLVSYPVPTTVVAIEKAVAVASRLGAEICATAVELEVPALAGPFTGALSPEGRAAAGQSPEHEKSVDNSKKMMQALEAAAKSWKTGCSQFIAPCVADDMGSVLAEQARLRDISLVAVKDHDGRQEKMIEALLFRSGRPLLLFPENEVGVLSNSFDRVAIAWDHSAQSARAVGDALPVLQRAKAVRVVTASDDKNPSLRESGEALIGHLARHGVQASFEKVEIGGSSVGKVFEAYVKANDIDLLVMGGYRHSRLREFVMGGATNTILARPPCWVLMSH